MTGCYIGYCRKAMRLLLTGVTGAGMSPKEFVVQKEELSIQPSWHPDSSYSHSRCVCYQDNNPHSPASTPVDGPPKNWQNKCHHPWWFLELPGGPPTPSCRTRCVYLGTRKEFIWDIGRGVHEDYIWLPDGGYHCIGEGRCRSGNDTRGRFSEREASISICLYFCRGRWSDGEEFHQIREDQRPSRKIASRITSIFEHKSYHNPSRVFFPNQGRPQSYTLVDRTYIQRNTHPFLIDSGTVQLYKCGRVGSDCRWTCERPLGRREANQGFKNTWVIEGDLSGMPYMCAWTSWNFGQLCNCFTYLRLELRCRGSARSSLRCLIDSIESIDERANAVVLIIELAAAAI